MPKNIAVKIDVEDDLTPASTKFLISKLQVYDSNYLNLQTISTVSFFD